MDIALRGGGSGQDLAQVIAGCWRDADLALARWTEALRLAPANRNPAAYRRSWARLNRAAAFPA